MPGFLLRRDKGKAQMRRRRPEMRDFPALRLVIY
jgi:hypothetical protein